MDEELLLEEMDDDEITVEDLKQHYLEKSLSAEDPVEADKWTAAYERLERIEMDSRISIENVDIASRKVLLDEERLEIDKERIDIEKKNGKIPLIAAAITVLGTVGGTMIGKHMDRNADIDTIEAVSNVEKTDGVIVNLRKYSRPNKNKNK